jgi:glutamate carboxypeptidase
VAGAGYHARDEYIEIDSIAPRLHLMARLLMTAANAS